ncbi:MAG: trypsin-like peptidase domain-containing protein [Dehalococcoidia bacterium]|nr:trypsin-like peptidase domain-containing protein [Dehalococcoidia bacterium]
MNSCSRSGRLILIMAVGFFIACTGSLASCIALPGLDSIYKRYPFVIRIVAGDKMGSGVMVNNSGYALTSWHVVGDDKTAHVTTSDGAEYTGNVLAVDRSKDLALIRVMGGAGEFACAKPGNSIESDDFQIGDAITIAGYPAYADSISPTVSRGFVCAFPTIESVSFIQASAQVYPGSSGGPMINRFGEVIGIVNGKYTNSSTGCTTFATAVDEASNLMHLVYGADNEKTSYTYTTPVKQVPASRICPNVGCKAPGFSLPGLDGEQVAIEACKGRKVLLVFSGSNCAGCSQIAQCVSQIYEAWPEDQLEVMVIVSGESDVVIRKWAAANGIKCKVLLDTEGQAADLYRPAAKPAAYFIDTYGKIKIKKIGILDNCSQEIDTLLRLY